MFARPIDFDCVAYVLQSLATMPWGWPIEVLLELPLADVQLRLRRFSHMPMPTPSKSMPVSFFRSLMGTKRVC